MCRKEYFICSVPVPLVSSDPSSGTDTMQVHTHARNLSFAIQQMNRPKHMLSKNGVLPTRINPLLNISNEFDLKVHGSHTILDINREKSPIKDAKLVLERLPLDLLPNTSQPTENDSITEKIRATIRANAERHEGFIESKNKEPMTKILHTKNSCNSYDFLKSMLRDDEKEEETQLKPGKSDESRKTNNSLNKVTKSRDSRPKASTAKKVSKKPSRTATKQKPVDTNSGNMDSDKPVEKKSYKLDQLPNNKEDENTDVDISPVKETQKTKLTSMLVCKRKERNSKSPSSDKDNKSHRRRRHKSSRHSSKQCDNFGDSDESGSSRCSTPMMTSTTTSTHKGISIKIRTVDPFTKTVHPVSIGRDTISNDKDTPEKTLSTTKDRGKKRVATQKKPRSKKKEDNSLESNVDHGDHKIMGELKDVMEKIDALKQESIQSNTLDVVNEDKDSNLQSAMEETSNLLFDLTRTKKSDPGPLEDPLKNDVWTHISGNSIEEAYKKKLRSKLEEMDKMSVESDDTVVDEPLMPNADSIIKLQVIADCRETPPHISSPSQDTKDSQMFTSSINNLPSDLPCQSPPQLYPMEPDNSAMPGMHRAIAELAQELGPPTMSPSHEQHLVSPSMKDRKQHDLPTLSLENREPHYSDKLPIMQSTPVSACKVGPSPKLNTSKSPRSKERDMWESMTNDVDSSLNNSEHTADEDYQLASLAGETGLQKKRLLNYNRTPRRDSSAEEFSPRHDVISPFRAFGQNKKTVKKSIKTTGRTKKYEKKSVVPNIDDPYAFNDEEDVFGSPPVKSASSTGSKTLFNRKESSEHLITNEKLETQPDEMLSTDSQPFISINELEKVNVVNKSVSQSLPKKKRGRPRKTHNVILPSVVPKETREPTWERIQHTDFVTMISDKSVSTPPPIIPLKSETPNLNNYSEVNIPELQIGKVPKVVKQPKLPKIAKFSKVLKVKTEVMTELPPEFKTRVMPTRRSRPPERLSYVPREGSEVESDEDVLEQKVPFRRPAPGGGTINYIPECVPHKATGNVSAIVKSSTPPTSPALLPSVNMAVAPALEVEEEDSVQMNDEEWLEKAATIFGGIPGSVRSRQSSVSGATPAHSTPGFMNQEFDDIPNIESNDIPSDDDLPENITGDAGCNSDDSDSDADPYLLRRTSSDGHPPGGVISAESRDPTFEIKIDENISDAQSLHSTGSSIKRILTSDHSRHSIRSPGSLFEEDLDFNKPWKYAGQVEGYQSDHDEPPPLVTNALLSDISSDEEIREYQPHAPNRRRKRYIVDSDSDVDSFDNSDYSKLGLRQHNRSFDSMENSPYSQIASSEVTEQSPVLVSHKDMQGRRLSNGSIRFPDLPCVEDCCHYGHQHETLPNLLQQLKESIDLISGNAQNSEDTYLGNSEGRYLFDPYTFISHSYYVPQSNNKLGDYADEQVCVPSPDGVFLDQVLYAGNTSPSETTMINMSDIVTLSAGEMKTNSIQQQLAQQRAADKLAKKLAKKEKRRRMNENYQPDHTHDQNNGYSELPNTMGNQMDQLLTASTLDFKNMDSDLVLQHGTYNGLMNNDCVSDSENLLLVLPKCVFQSPCLSIDTRLCASWDLMASPNKLPAMCGDDPGGGSVPNQTQTMGLYACGCGEIFTDDLFYSQHEPFCASLMEYGV